jgi:Skp family chaperone for outer membrane proteins
MCFVIVAISVALSAGPAWAQAPAAQTPPAQAPAAQTPPAAQPPADKPQPPRPFPEGAKVAYVNVNAIAAGSVEGKAATGKIQEYVKKKNAEIQDKQKALQTLQGKLQAGLSVMSDQARAQMEKDITKQSRELQSAQEDAQAEQQQLTQDLQNEFQQKLYPIIDQIAKERGLHMVLSVADSGAIWADTGLDISAEVIKRFDAAVKTGATKK